MGITDETKKKYIGTKHGHLKIIGFANNRKFMSGQTQPVAMCVCDCGMMTEKLLYHVLSGATTTCGLCKSTDSGERVPKEPQVWHAAGDSLYTDIKGQRVWIDRNDYSLIKGNLTIDGSGYASYGRERLHIAIMRPQKGQYVDHINGDRLDNRRNNLRICTQSSNSINTVLQKSNTTGYKGVHPVRPASDGPRYGFQVTKNKKRHSKGIYKTPEEAARAYDAMAIKLHGPYACLNFPEDYPDHPNRRPARRLDNEAPNPS